MTETAHGGARTGARALAMAAAESSKKRKLENHEIAPYIELRSRRKNRRRTAVDSGRRSLIQDSERRDCVGSSDRGSDSCCSSNGSSDDRRFLEFADLEDESGEVESSAYCSCRERRETTPSSQLREELSDELDSMAGQAPPAAANSRRRSIAPKMPTESELEEFFTKAEKNIQKQFAEKYNYDIEKDTPLEGRYQWVRLKP